MSAEPECTDDLPITTDRNGNTIEVGTRVRSFDFPDHGERDIEGERACFIEGIVIGVSRNGWDCPRYVIAPKRRIFAGKDTTIPVGTFYYPPLNGTPSWLGGETSGVEAVRES